MGNAEGADPGTLVEWRVEYAAKAALAHVAGNVPWRAVPRGQLLPQEDRDWCTAVGEAVNAKAARLPHPNTDIEKLLQDMTAT